MDALQITYNSRGNRCDNFKKYCFNLNYCVDRKSRDSNLNITLSSMRLHFCMGCMTFDLSKCTLKIYYI